MHYCYLLQEVVRSPLSLLCLALLCIDTILSFFEFWVVVVVVVIFFIRILMMWKQYNGTCTCTTGTYNFSLHDGALVEPAGNLRYFLYEEGRLRHAEAMVLIVQ